MIKYRPNKLIYIFAAVFGGVGIIFILLMISSLCSWISFKEKAVETTAVITDIRTEHSTYRQNGKTKHRTAHEVSIEYKVDGVTYNNDLDYYTSGMSEGDEITILYDPENPEKHRSYSWVVCITFGVFIVVFGGIGFALGIYEFKKTKYINSLIDRNEYVVCYEWEEVNSGTTVNNVRYKMIVCRYEGAGGTLTFHSHPYHPAKRPFYPGQPVTVYVDVNDPNKYYVCEEN